MTSKLELALNPILQTGYNWTGKLIIFPQTTMVNFICNKSWYIKHTNNANCAQYHTSMQCFYSWVRITYDALGVYCACYSHLNAG